ncbi:MAG: hypothetical protein HC908_08415 [Calothrix sp. SM1_7_51]|nr:hypothetical protein [Calothrix sp. SM1_7_51]
MAKLLEHKLKEWLNESPSFRPIREKIYEQLDINDDIRVLLQAEDSRLWQLPWHLWDFFQRYHSAELAVSTPVYEEVTVKNISSKKIRILAILGDRTGIDIEADRQFLENLPNTEVVFLVEPKRQELDSKLWDEIGWDILFFAGHSRTQGETGEIDINDNESLTIDN